MKNFYIKFYLILLLSSFAFSKTLTMATGEWSPWVSKSLKHYGAASYIAKEAFKTQNIDLEFNFYPWKRAYLTAKVTKDDVSGFWLKNKKREKDFYFSDEIFTIKNVFIFKKGKNIKFDSIDDLKNYKVAITRGYSYSQKIDDMIKNSQLDIHTVNSDLAGLRQTLKKDIFDVFICSLSVASELLKDNFTQEEIDKLQISRKSVFEKGVYLMVSKEHKDNQKILNSFNKGLKELRSKGIITKMIEDSYIGKYK